MNILLLSTGGGGGNILRSLKTLFERDVAIAHNTDPAFAERLRRAVTTRFLDTNEFALSDLPKEERFLIGSRTTGRLGARHDPAVALEALSESRNEVEALFSRYSIIILIGTGGKGTGSGTMFPLAQIARQQRKLVIPIFVRPSFERHEVDKRHYDYAVKAIEQFDTAGIRLIEILNDRGYAEHDPQPQPTVWERMNLPIARGLVKRVVRIVATSIGRPLHHAIIRLATLGRIDFREANSQTAVTGKQDREVGWIDL